MSCIAAKPHARLESIPTKALEQLTRLLYVDSRSYFGAEVEEWLSRQEEQLENLDDADAGVSLVRGKGLVSRLAFAMERRGLVVPPLLRGARARLCSWHRRFDPRLIRRLMLLVAAECTVHADRFRSLRQRARLAPSLGGWLGRVDALTALWIGRRKVEGIFGMAMEKVSALPACVGAGCEACVLAVVGGSAVCLADLRASLLARHAFRRTSTAGGRSERVREPRLLRIVDMWISFYDAKCRHAVRACSDSIVGDLVAMRMEYARRRDRHTARRGVSAPKAKAQTTKGGLPIPRRYVQDGRRRKDDMEPAHHSSNPNPWGNTPQKSHGPGLGNEEWEEEDWVKEYRNLVVTDFREHDDLRPPPSPSPIEEEYNPSSEQHLFASFLLPGDSLGLNLSDDDPWTACSFLESKNWIAQSTEEQEEKANPGPRSPSILPLDRTISMLSSMHRGSAMPLPLRRTKQASK